MCKSYYYNFLQDICMVDFYYKLIGMYTIFKKLSLPVLLSVFIMCKPGTTPPAPIKIIINDSNSLKSVSSFPIGASVNVRLLKTDSLYRSTLSSQFNSMTPENALKWEAIHPELGKFDFTNADLLVNFALVNNIRFHGHNLVWYQSNPKWLENFSGNNENWDTLLKNHIQTVVSRYKGKIASWDVVNEAFDEKGNIRKNDIWAKNMGIDYIAKAFLYAHEADPNAVLFYNDYGQEQSEAKTESILNMVKDLKKRNIPIGGLGIQMHIKLNTSENKIKEILKQFAQTGLKIHISELDIAVNTKNDSTMEFTSDLKNQLAAKYKFIVEAYKFAVPPSLRYGITTWDIGDKDSWLRKYYNKNDWPLLFDDEYKKKDCYYAFLQALKN